MERKLHVTFYLLLIVMKLKKSYIAYTDNTYEEDGSIKAYAAVYHPDDLNAGFEPIETEKEWKVVETILNTIQEEVRNKVNQANSDNNSGNDTEA